jgi:hypothetical protein
MGAGKRNYFSVEIARVAKSWGLTERRARAEEQKSRRAEEQKNRRIVGCEVNWGGVEMSSWALGESTEMVTIRAVCTELVSQLKGVRLRVLPRVYRRQDRRITRG